MTTETREGVLLVVSAPSGAGKTSLVRGLLERDPGLSLSVSCTTRPPRPGERDGVDYHFLERDAFSALADDGGFIEHAEVFGNLYGTRSADVRRIIDAGGDLILEIDWQGARQVREHLPGAVGIFILPPSLAELERRLRGRGTDAEDVIARRLAQAKADIAHFAEYDYAVVNDRLDEAIAALGAVVAAERLRTRRRRAEIQSLFETV